MVESPLNCTKRNRVCTRSISATVGNLGSALSPPELTQKACNIQDIGRIDFDCFEGLLLSLLPDAYNSNNPADTPQGVRLVRPAQVIRLSACWQPSSFS